MEIVNGYPCFDCTDVERAKKAAVEGAQAFHGDGPGTAASAEAEGEVGLAAPADPARGRNFDLLA